jgi:glycosyltransferase involved in cell wall biosynthesis
LIERGHHVAVITGRQQLDTSVDMASDLIRFVAGGSWTWRDLRPILRTVAHDAPEIVHIQYQAGAYQMRPMIHLLPMFLRRLRPRPRIVVTTHDLRLPYLLPKADLLRHWMVDHLLRDADAVIVTNTADHQRLRGVGAHHREFFLARRPIPATAIPIGSNVAPRPPAGYDRARWRHALGIGPDDIVVAFFGLASRSKGLFQLVSAIDAGLPHIHLLVIGGDGQTDEDRHYAAELRLMVEQLRLRHRVHFSGFCDPPAVSAHLLAADIGALPFTDGASYRRGSLIAMLAHGVPIITTQPEQPLDPPLIDREHVLLIDDAEPVRITWAIELLAEDEPLRARLAVNARALGAYFTWPAIAAAHEAVYNALMGNS